MARAQGVAEWVRELARAGATPLLVLVIHGDLLGYLLRALLNVERVRFLHYNTATTALDSDEAGGWTMLHANRCAHLSGAERTGAEMLAVVS